MSYTDAASVVSEGGKNIHRQNTFICGSLYDCEIRACWPAVSTSKQLKQIVLKTFERVPQNIARFTMTF